MSNRTRQNSELHDWIIQETVNKYYQNIKYEINTNPNGIKTKEVEGEYPDIVISNGNEVIIIDEIETEDSVNEVGLEQWKRYASLNTKKFILTVPKEKLNEAVNLTKDINCEIWYYEVIEIDGKRILKSYKFK